jgi:hypothetical protein
VLYGFKAYRRNIGFVRQGKPPRAKDWEWSFQGAGAVWALMDREMVWGKWKEMGQTGDEKRGNAGGGGGEGGKGLERVKQKGRKSGFGLGPENKTKSSVICAQRA